MGGRHPGPGGIALVALLIGTVIGGGTYLVRFGFAVDWAVVSVRLLWLSAIVFVVVLAAVYVYLRPAEDPGRRNTRDDEKAAEPLEQAQNALRRATDLGTCRVCRPTLV